MAVERPGSAADPIRSATPTRYPDTPDGRYFVVRGRLWRKSDPSLPPERREALVRELMNARRALRGEGEAAQRADARRAVEVAKQALGERGPVWWTDGAPDYNRKLARNTPYAVWFAELQNATPDGAAGSDRDSITT